MKALLNGLRKIAAAIIHWLSSSDDSEWTMHDALRVCQTAATRQASIARLSPRRPLEVCLYGSETDLVSRWRQLDVSCPTNSLNAVVVLSRRLSSGLRPLIRRRFPASRLILVPSAGIWPGADSPVDLALSTTSLGWQSIEVCRDVGQALEQGMNALERNEHVVVFWPLAAADACKLENEPMRRIM